MYLSYYVPVAVRSDMKMEESLLFLLEKEVAVTARTGAVPKSGELPKTIFTSAMY